ncbi:MAG: hypothetical protein WA666_04775, partial [Nitrospirota bacterium]
MSKMKMLLTVVMALGLTLGLAGMASAASISCGQCHGAIFNNASTGSAGSTSVDARTLPATDVRALPSYENDLTPSYDNDRGLHGIHMNYSSASYGTGGAGGAEAGRGVCAYCHADNHPNHESGFMQWSTIESNFLTTGGSHGYTTLGRPLTFLRYSSDQGGTSWNHSVSSMNSAVRTGSCTAACHKGTTQANPAPWGNYTSANVKLTCNSCHGDASNDGGSGTGYGLSSPAGAGHTLHLTQGAEFNTVGSGGIRIVFGGVTAGVLHMGAADGATNAECALCHPDNTSQGGQANLVRGANGNLLDWGPVGANGLGKAYPHATDGTNVQSKNAVVGGAAGITLSNNTGLYSNPSCTQSCHFNKYVSTWGPIKGGLDPTWNGGGNGCDTCHNHQAFEETQRTAARPLSFAHTLHFQMISSMLIGSYAGGTSHGVYRIAGTPSCGDCHTVAGLHTNYMGVVNIVQLPVLNGTAGLYAGGTNTVGWSATQGAGATLTTHGTCTNRCHVGGSPYWDSVPTNDVQADLITLGTETGCTTCHEYPGVNDVSGKTYGTSSGNPITAGQDWNANNGHSVRSAFNESTSVLGLAGQLKHLSRLGVYNKITDTYAGVTSDPTKCGKCHSGIKHGDAVTVVQA